MSHQASSSVQKLSETCASASMLRLLSCEFPFVSCNLCSVLQLVSLRVPTYDNISDRGPLLHHGP
jgi:hypothetical protein